MSAHSAPVSGRREGRAPLSFSSPESGCSVLEWQNNIAALATQHRVYAFDMLGHGLTDKPQKNCYAIADLARFTLRAGRSQRAFHWQLAWRPHSA